MQGRYIRSNSPTSSNASRETRDTEAEVPTQGKKEPQPREKSEFELEIERKVKAEREQREAAASQRRLEESKTASNNTMSAIREARKYFEQGEADMEKLDGNLASINESDQSIDRVNKQFQKISDTFDELFKNCLRGYTAQAQTQPTEELQALHGVPQTYTVDQMAEEISHRKSICVLIGAGVSAESGVPTYKGNTNTVSIGGKQMTHQEIAYRSIFEQHPLDYWNYPHKFKQHTSQIQPNAVHHAIARLVNHFNTEKTSGFVITQNIDGFDRAVKQSGEVFEIHGNLDYMKCSQQCTKDLYPSNLGGPQELTVVPTCPKCGALCIPHMLNFDESYSEEYYRAQTAANMFDTIDVLVILGTQLATNLANRLARQACAKKVLVLEGNIEPVLEYGNVMVNKQPLGQSFPAIVEKIIAIDDARGQVRGNR